MNYILNHIKLNDILFFLKYNIDSSLFMKWYFIKKVFLKFLKFIKNKNNQTK